MTKKQLLSVIDSNEISEWLAFDNCFTLPDGHYVASTVGLTVARHSMGGSKSKLEDYAPIYRAPPRRPTAEDVLRIFGAFKKARV